MNCENIFTVYLKKLRDQRTLISTIVIPTLVIAVMLFGMGKIMSKVTATAREEVPVVMVGLWPLYGIRPLHFIGFQ